MANKRYENNNPPLSPLILRGGEKGAALITALLFLVILTALGMAAMYTSSSEIMIANNHYKSKEALYFAQAGVNDAMSKLDHDLIPNIPDPVAFPLTFAGWSSVSFTPITSTVGNLHYKAYVKYKLEDAFHNDGDATSNEAVRWNKKSGVDGGFNYSSSPVVNANQGPWVFTVVSVATVNGESGATAELRVDVTKNVINAYVPAGFYTAGCLDLKGNAARIYGSDAGGIVPPPGLPGVMTGTAGCTDSFDSDISGAGGAAQTANPGDPFQMTTSTTGYLGISMSELAANAQYVYPQGATDLGPGPYGSPPGNPVVIVCRHSEDVNNLKGYGILYVNGDLNLKGGFEWKGMVYVTGSVNLAGGGGVVYNIDGGIMAGGTNNAVENGSIAVTYNQKIINDINKFSFKNRILNWNIVYK